MKERDDAAREYAFMNSLEPEVHLEHELYRAYRAGWDACAEKSKALVEALEQIADPSNERFFTVRMQIDVARYALKEWSGDHERE